MNKKIVAIVSLILVHGIASADPIFTSYQATVADLNGQEVDLTVSFQYDPTTIPVCTTSTDGSGATTYNCNAVDFIDLVSLNIDGTTISVQDPDSSYSFFGIFFPGEVANNFVFGNTPLGLYQVTEGYDNTLNLFGNFFDLFLNKTGEDGGQGFGVSSFFGSSVVFYGGMSGTDFVFNSALVDGVLVNVPEPGTLALLFAGLMFIFFRRRDIRAVTAS